jgi:hypothetical protein
MSTIYMWRPSEQFTPTSLSICCPRCEYSLTLHQPDSDLPDRLLATCDECKSWFLANSDGVGLIPLPELPNDVIPSETDSLIPWIRT